MTISFSHDRWTRSFIYGLGHALKCNVIENLIEYIQVKYRQCIIYCLYYALIKSPYYLQGGWYIFGEVSIALSMCEWHYWGQDWIPFQLETCLTSFISHPLWISILSFFILLIFSSPKLALCTPVLFCSSSMQAILFSHWITWTVLTFLVLFLFFYFPHTSDVLFHSWLWLE